MRSSTRRTGKAFRVAAHSLTLSGAALAVAAGVLTRSSTASVSR